jgi:hypothetical protein
VSVVRSVTYVEYRASYRSKMSRNDEFAMNAGKTLRIEKPLVGLISSGLLIPSLRMVSACIRCAALGLPVKSALLLSRPPNRNC